MKDNRTFYGPHPCINCGAQIVKASQTEGGEEFENPIGPIYPNTEWVRHNCQIIGNQLTDIKTGESFVAATTVDNSTQDTSTSTPASV